VLVFGELIDEAKAQISNLNENILE